MMSYKVSKKKTIYHIMENKISIFETQNKKKAYDLCRGLNLGNGFQKNTPTFFTNKYSNMNGD